MDVSSCTAETLLTPDVAAQRLAVSRRRLYALVHRGLLRPVYLGPRQLRVPEAAVNALIAAGGRR